MALRPRFTKADVQRQLDKALADAEYRIIQNLLALGEQCVNEARESGSYMDRTGNLRSSTGYVVLANGRMVRANFRAVSGPEPSEQSGELIGESYALSLAADHPTGYVLIVVAGMEYAAHVEATGRDVLDSAERLAADRIPGIIAKLKTQLGA